MGDLAAVLDAILNDIEWSNTRCVVGVTLICFFLSR